MPEPDKKWPRSKTAKFQYKCRQCGAVEENPCTSEKNATLILIHTIIGGRVLPEHLIGTKPEMVSTHSCDNGAMGVSDLIGYKVYDE